MIASSVGDRIQMMRTPPSVGVALTRMVGLLLGDVVLTCDEINGLVDGLLMWNGQPTGTIRLAG